MNGRRRGPLQPHPFEPARLVLGLALLVVAVLYGARAAGDDRLPLVVLAVLVPGALVLAGVVAVITQAVRRARARSRR